jgi:hypothetical protein
MHEVVGEAILPNTFSKHSSASSRKSLMKLFSKKNSFTSEIEPLPKWWSSHSVFS